jgi:hypothetical protein
MASPNVVGTPNNQVWASQTRIDANSSSYWWNFQVTPAGTGDSVVATTTLISSVIASPNFI